MSALIARLRKALPPLDAGTALSVAVIGCWLVIIVCFVREFL